MLSLKAKNLKNQWNNIFPNQTLTVNLTKILEDLKDKDIYDSQNACNLLSLRLPFAHPLNSLHHEEVMGDENE